MSSLRTQSTCGGVVSLNSVGSDRTGGASTVAGSHSHSHRKHHHHHRSRSAPRAPEKPPRKRHLNPGQSLASIPSQIKLSMLNSGLISFGEFRYSHFHNTTILSRILKLIFRYRCIFNLLLFDFLSIIILAARIKNFY